MAPHKRKPPKKQSVSHDDEDEGSSRSRGRRWAIFGLKALVLSVIWGGLLGGLLVVWYAWDMPDIRQVVQPERRPSITLLADDGSVLIRYGDFTGKPVTLADVPPSLVQAVMAVEDRRFRSHRGVDPLGLTRAVVHNLLAGSVVEGGSTITQQLAKNLFLTPERTARRKVQEMLLALWLEHTYTKDQILAAYLNRVYFGAGAYGVDAAAETYFGKPISAVNLRESAVLAGLLKAPSRFSPLRDPSLALERARVVLSAMVDAGYITEEQRQATLVDIPVPRRKPESGDDIRYFADWVTHQASSLIETFPQDVTILTTLDPHLQGAAGRALASTLNAEELHAVTEGTVITLAPDGAVRALVGGRDYDVSQFNRATQAQRQPGSAFKPIVYLAALEEGLSPDDVFVDEPFRIGRWEPVNYDGTYRGSVTAHEALAKSINTVAVRVLNKIGVEKAIRTARALGISSPLAPNLSLALGSSALSPLELTAAYASLAAGGRPITPYAIREIRANNGPVLYRRQEATPPVQVSSQAVARLIPMLEEVITSGTGKAAALGDRPVAGKTGTSSDYRDAWFLGFTADYTTGVWLGNDNNAPMKTVTGGAAPARLWHAYMVQAEASLPVRPLPLPGGQEENRVLPSGTRPESAPKPSSFDPIGSLLRAIMGE